MKSTLVLSALCGLAAAHFKMQTPPSIGFDDSKEGTAPCGGFTPDLSTAKVQDFHVGGQPVGMSLFHSQGTWLFRATTDPKAASGWDEVFPIVEQTGLGNLCEPSITINETWVGKKGWFGIASHTADGLLYQCIAANFVSGSSAQSDSTCSNGSSVKAAFTSDSILTALLDDSSSSPSSTTGSPSGTAASSAPSSTNTSSDKGGAGSVLEAWTTTSLLTVLAMAVLGATAMA